MKTRPKHFDVIDKINKKISDSFTPETNKKDKEKFEKMKSDDPKYQEWRKNHPHLKEKVEKALHEARAKIDNVKIKG